MIIDCHTHVNWQGHDADDAVRHMDRLGVDRAWVLSWEDKDGGIQPGAYQHLPVAEVIKAARRHPDRLVPFCGIDPRREDPERVLRELVDQGCKGYGEIKVRLLADNPDLLRMYRLCAELRLPVLIHIDVPLPHTGMWYAGSVDALERSLLACPETDFIGHGPGFWREISGSAPRSKKPYPAGKVRPGGKLPNLLTKYPHLYADLSANSGLNALRRDVPHARGFLKTFRKKVLYGTDMYNRDHLDFLESLDLDPHILADILGDNAARLLPA
jgi:hypothetical protein